MPDEQRLSSPAADWPAVYDQLWLLAVRRLADERAGHTLQATALVHEVYVKLWKESPDRWADAAHFYHVAAEAMRRTLVDHARARGRLKRANGQPRVPLSQVMDVATLEDSVDPADVLAMDAAVARLESINPEAGEVVRLRFFAGLSVEQTAAAANMSPRTVKRKWVYAKAWLYRELSPQSTD